MLIETLVDELSAVKSRGLSRHQGVLVAESRGAALRPLFKLAQVRRENLAPLALAVGWDCLVGRRDRERSVVVVIEQLDVAVRRPEKLLRLPGRGESRLVVAGHEACLEFENPVPTDHRGHSVLRELRLERTFIEHRISERGEVGGLPSHVANEPLLADDNVDHIAKLGLAGEVETALRLWPYLVEVIASQEKVREEVVAAVAGDRQVTSFKAGAEGRADVPDGGLRRLRPEGHHLHREVGLRLVGDDAVLLNKFTGEPAEAVAVVIPVEYRPENDSEPGEAGCGRVGRSIF